jgi:hypothetical protein
MFEGLLRGRDWDAAVLVARERARPPTPSPRCRARTTRTCRSWSSPTGDDDAEASTWRALGARLVVRRSELGDVPPSSARCGRRRREATPPAARPRRRRAVVAGAAPAAAGGRRPPTRRHAGGAARTPCGRPSAPPWSRPGARIPAAWRCTRERSPRTTAELRLRIGFADAAPAAGGPGALGLRARVGVSVSDLGSTARPLDTEPRASGEAPRPARPRLRAAKRRPGAGPAGVHAAPLWVDGEMAAVLLLGLARRRGRSTRAWRAPRGCWARDAAADVAPARRGGASPAALEEHAWGGWRTAPPPATPTAGSPCATARRAPRLRRPRRRPAEGWREAWRLTDVGRPPGGRGRRPAVARLGGETLVRAATWGRRPRAGARPMLVDAHPVDRRRRARRRCGRHPAARRDPTRPPPAEALAARERRWPSSAACSTAPPNSPRPWARPPRRRPVGTARRLRPHHHAGHRLAGPRLDGDEPPEARRRSANAATSRGRCPADHDAAHGERVSSGPGAARSRPTVFDELHATAAVMAANLLAVALDHADLVVKERELRPGRGGLAAAAGAVRREPGGDRADRARRRRVARRQRRLRAAARARPRGAARHRTAELAPLARSRRAGPRARRPRRPSRSATARSACATATAASGAASSPPSAPSTSGARRCC